MKKPALVLCLLLAGCAMQEMETGSETPVGNGIYVTPQPGFAEIHLAAIRYWTRNGTGLDELGFYTGIKDGEPLFPIPGMTKKELPSFRSQMTPNDIAELAASALTAKYKQAARSSNLHPCPFGPVTGFCFDLSLTNEEGLEMRGRCLARLQHGVLDLLMFTAPAEYYFAEVGPSVDRIYSSISIK
ncbi:MAG TPA: hypothetical protein VMO78_16385 [Rhizomicrobium sp.]|nr:hypothetical protein [Rhizomicrobium sp.]